jgi:glycosyltransferase involved in cell wall biosynthesis
MVRPSVGIVIPAFNEALTIASVINSVSKFGVPIVVDDASSDNTGGIAISCLAKVVTHKTNLGYDEALNSGFLCAKKLGLEFIITLDADGQHDPLLIEKIVNHLKDGADLVIGVRNHTQRFSEYFFGVVTNFLWSIKDPLSGLKGYRVSLYKEKGSFDTYGSIGTELCVFAAKNKKIIFQFPIVVKPRLDRPRFGNPMTANYKILRALFFGLIK